MSNKILNRRSFLASAGALAALPAFAKKKPLIGLEMYSVRTEMAKNIFEPVKAVAKMGYECVEFYGPYINWTPDQVKEMRSLLDSLKIRCMSTHNDSRNLLPENIQKAIDINKTLGSEYIVMASAGRVEPTVEGWKKVADVLTKASEITKSAGLKVGYHNHGAEFKALGDTFPLEVIAKNTPANVMLQLDVGTCVEAGRDPVAWIKANKGRINCIHCKDWSKANGYKVLFGEGDSPWKAIFKAAEKEGGVQFYLIEQEGHALPPFEAVDKCLVNFKKIHG